MGPWLSTVSLLMLSAPPSAVHVQGALRHAGGPPVDGSYGMDVSLYPAESGAGALFSQVFSSVVVQDGVFSVLLKPVMPAIFRDHDQVWVEVSVAGEPPLPRTRVWAVPMALVSAESLSLSCSGCVTVENLAPAVAQTLLGSGAVSTQQLADGAVTAQKLGIPCAAGAVLKVDASGAWACGADVGSPWVAGDLASLSYGLGNVGIGVVDPPARLSVDGAVQVGSTTLTCVAELAGSLRYLQENIEFCDGNAWRPIYQPPKDGQTEAQAGISCRAILNDGYNAGDGTYWIRPNPSKPAFQAWCDMITDGGGWTLLGTVSGAQPNVWTGEPGLWGTTDTYGSVSSPFGDYKSEAWNSLAITGAEVLYVRRFSGAVKAQTKFGPSCQGAKSTFREVFATWDVSIKCPSADVTPLKVPGDTAGLAADTYREGAGPVFGPGSTGFCWNGGDSQSNMFKGRLIATYDSALSCYYDGHYGPGVGVFWTNGDAQYGGYDDIEATNMFNQTDRSKTAISLLAR